MIWLAAATLLCLLVYGGAIVAVGQARGRFGIAAPATTGHPTFERILRAQINTLEWLPIYLPALWLCGLYTRAPIAAALGLVWSLGRVMYVVGYAQSAQGRTAGFMIQLVATVALLLGAIVGVIQALAR